VRPLLQYLGDPAEFSRRRLKRRCTKELPSCSLVRNCPGLLLSLLYAHELQCVRLAKTCLYGRSPGRASAEEVESLVGRIKDLERRLEARVPSNMDSAGAIEDLVEPLKSDLESRSSMSLFCLDSGSFAGFSPRVLNAGAAVPPEVSALLGSSDDVDAMCTLYFSSIDVWCRILSRKRVLQRVQAYNSSTDASFALLLLCMKMIISPPAGGEAVTKIYRTACGFSSLLEQIPSISLELLQARVLIAMYEVGHSIFPAAFFSVGHAARMSMLMGLHDRKHAAQLFRTTQTWTVREEERRAWWGVFILERHVTNHLSRHC
jgi:hypothetical protein